MKAFIPAAGLGTRLGKFTKEKPKALIEVNGMTMLELTIERLKKQGIRQFMVNVHHFSGQVIQYLESKNNFGVDIKISDESAELLDTGGAIHKAEAFFQGNEPVLIHNADVISEVNFSQLEKYHSSKKALATLCIRKRKSSRALLFNDEMELVGWTNKQTKQFKWVSHPVSNFQSFAFSGIYLASPGFSKLLPFTGKFSIIDAWLQMAKTEKIVGFLDNSPLWFDMGTPEKIAAAENALRKTVT